MGARLIILIPFTLFWWGLVGVFLFLDIKPILQHLAAQ